MSVPTISPEPSCDVDFAGPFQFKIAAMVTEIIEFNSDRFFFMNHPLFDKYTTLGKLYVFILMSSNIRPNV